MHIILAIKYKKNLLISDCNFTCNKHDLVVTIQKYNIFKIQFLLTDTKIKNI